MLSTIDRLPSRLRWAAIVAAQVLFLLATQAAAQTGTASFVAR
jgi:hypothetical protein